MHEEERCKGWSVYHASGGPVGGRVMGTGHWLGGGGNSTKASGVLCSATNGVCHVLCATCW